MYERKTTKTMFRNSFSRALSGRGRVSVQQLGHRQPQLGREQGLRIIPGQMRPLLPFPETKILFQFLLPCVNR